MVVVVGVEIGAETVVEGKRGEGLVVFEGWEGGFEM